MNTFAFRALRIFVVLFHCAASLAIAHPAMASDGYIKTDDNEFGQGIFRRRGTECLVITPLHVVDNAFKIDITLADKRKFPAEMIESFPGDISVLRIMSDDAISCKTGPFFNETQVDAMLNAEKHGELRTMLADGSIRIIPVNIVGYDKFRNIHVAPQDPSTAFTKGESGSPLYIAGRFAGVLLSVTNNIGNIIRSDTLSQTVALFFDDKTSATPQSAALKKSGAQTEKPAKKPLPTDGHEFKGVIANSAVVEHTIKLEGNSPVRLSFVPTGDNQQFNIEILDRARRIVLQNRNKPLNGSESATIPFTPPTSDTYSIFIAGTKGEGKYAFTVTPITTDAHLRSAANAVHIGGNAVHGIIVHGAVAEYSVQLEGNSPIRLHLPATEDQVRYSLDIVDAAGKSVYRDSGKQYSAGDTVTVPFTPQKSGKYSIRIKGTEGEGAYSLQLLPIASNSQLRGEANILGLNETPAEGIVAQGAVAEYRLQLEALRPVRFQFSASGDQGRFSVEIVDSTGTAVYLNPSKRYDGTEAFTIPFTAPKTDTYVVRIAGVEGECRYSVSVQHVARK